ncbi:Protein of unknown function DUF4228 [Cynara cardunculus var. scolymus]|uniref:Uncharacterized protein n=1 Tax=Cynara cardunculus var. scolymus TaxID=59895 RepID=A0A103YEJ4_CYNCS|nr:Protein of unknown function DUF4228 [Cynara cardunculus var. scolymus]
MGACLSATTHSIDRSTICALVISVKGELRNYPTPIFVSELLQFENPSSHPSSFFLCNSDNLYYDQHISALHLEDELDAGQIYFILPKSMLGRRLGASDMAALAVKASVALDSNAITNSSQQPKSRKNNNKSRISPLENSHMNVTVEEEIENKNYNASLGVSRSGSIRKVPRYSSRKARLAVRSFRLRLSTIYENEGGSDDQLQANVM